MKKLVLFAGLLCFIPFAGNCQFKEKNKPSNSNNNSNNNNNNNNNGNSNSGNSGNNDKNKPKQANTEKFSGDYDAPEAFSASFEDGSNIDYTLSDRNPDKIAHLAIWFPANFSFSLSGSPQGPNPSAGLISWDQIGMSYYQPNTFYLELNAGFIPLDAELDGLIFFKEWSKVGQMKVVLKSTASGNVRTNYVSKVDMPAKAYLGVHVGFGMRNWGNVNNSGDGTLTYQDQYGNSYTVTEGYNLSYTYNTPQITLGLGYMSILHYKMFTSNNNRTRMTSIQSAIYADALLYPSATISNWNGTFTEGTYTGYGNGVITTSVPEPTTFKPGLLQGRFYLESKVSRVRGNYEWGYTTKFGVGTNPFGYTYLFANWGLYFKLM